MLEDIDPSTIEDAAARAIVIRVLNVLENIMHQFQAVKEENQHLKDELNRLKGEQGKPDVRPHTSSAASNYSSTNYTRPPKKTRERDDKGKKAKLSLSLTRTEKLIFERHLLPPDAVFKGYEEVVVQEVVLRPEVILFRKEKFYSPSQRMTYLAPLPQGFEGQFGPGLKALVLQLYYQAQLSEPKLLEVLHTFGFEISPAQISDWLIHTHQPIFEAEKQAILQAGLESTPWQHFDHTATRALGQNRAAHILCNPYYTVFTTLPQRDRLSVLRVLLGDQAPTYCYNQQARTLLEQLGLPRKWHKRLAGLEEGRMYSQGEIEAWLEQEAAGLGSTGRKWVLDALAIAAYHNQKEWPIVHTLVCDDAPVFNHLSEQLALCWIHEARPYTRLTPRLAYHRTILEDFRGRFWRYYERLLAYTQNPTSSQAAWLRGQFDLLFTAGGEYEGLDAQKAKTRAKREQLLLVLEEPYLPLHNNPAELGARQRVRKRDVSLAAASEAGVRAWDALQSVVATCKKLGVNVYRYLLDRVSGKNELSSLAQTIRDKARENQSQGQAYAYYPSERSRERSQVARAKHTGPPRQHQARQPKTKVEPAGPPSALVVVSGLC